MPQRRFPRPWRFEPIPGGYRVIDANGLALAHVYGEPRDAIAISDKRLTNKENRSTDRPPSRICRARDGSEQGQEPPQAAAASVHAGTTLSGMGSC